MNILKRIAELILGISTLRQWLIHSIALDSLGTDASPNDAAPDELGCAESVTEILKAANTMPYVEISTYRLYNYFLASPNWELVDTPRPGDVVLSPTAYSSKRPVPFVGHVGIVGKNDTIMSNDSATGKFMSNYTMLSWRNRWVKRGGYPMLFYRYKFIT